MRVVKKNKLIKLRDLVAGELFQYILDIEDILSLDIQMRLSPLKDGILYTSVSIYNGALSTMDFDQDVVRTEHQLTVFEDPER